MSSAHPGPGNGGPIVIQEQGSFFVGGRTIAANGVFEPNALDADLRETRGQSYHVDQLYVRYQVPPNARHLPIVFVHGSNQTGKTWESTPDGREANTIWIGILVSLYQDLALADKQTIYMNLFLGREATKGPFRRLDRKRMIRETEALVRDLEVRIPSPTALVRDLSGGQRQGIAIARATHWATKLILMDEPTAALGVAETARVEKIIASLKARGLAILMISHSLDQVLRLADRICVLRRGVQIGIRDTASTSKNEIVSMITGLT